MAPEERSYSTADVVAILRRVNLFDGLPDEDLERIAAVVEGSSAEAGEVLFEEGEPGDRFYVVYSGAVEIVKSLGEGDEEKLAVRRAGEAFGEMALLDDAPRSATARAAEETQLISVAREDFERLFDDDTLAYRMMRALSKALRALGVRFAAAERAAHAHESDGGTPAADVNRALQRALLPSEAPRMEGYDLAGGTMLADHGAGDTAWVSIPLPGGGGAMAALAVQGEGPPPAVALALARAFFLEFGRTGGPDRLLARVNDALAESAVPGSAQTLACALVVPGEDGLVWSSAGAVHGAILRREGTLEELPAQGPPLGMLPGFAYQERAVPMGPGDMAIVLSRGSTGLFRGVADLVATLQQKPAGEVVATVHRALRKSDEAAVDEATVLFVRRH